MLYVFSCDITIKQYHTVRADDEASALGLAARNAGVDASELTLVEVRQPEPTSAPKEFPARAYRDRYAAYE